MSILILAIHLIVCFALILIVLLQTGKGADMGAVFGGAGNQTLFGNTGASTLLSKATTGAAIIFMLTSLSLAYISKSGDESVISDIKPAAQQTQTIPTEAESPEAAPTTEQQTAPQTAPPATSNAEGKQQSDTQPSE